MFRGNTCRHTRASCPLPLKSPINNANSLMCIDCASRRVAPCYISDEFIKRSFVYFYPLDDVPIYFSPTCTVVSMEILHEIASHQPRHMLEEAISGMALNLIAIVTRNSSSKRRSAAEKRRRFIPHFHVRDNFLI